MPRTLWKGFIRLSVVSVPIKAYTATESGRELHFRQLHRECNSPINYRKVCPIHGELDSSDIVSGYEVAKGEFVIVEPSDIEKVRPDAEKAVTIDGFAPAGSIDPIHFSGKTYYLLPDGIAGQTPYALLHKGMVLEEQLAVAQAVLFGREHVAVLRPLDGLLAMNVLFYDDQVKDPADFKEEVPEVSTTAAELKLTRTLIQASKIEDFDIARYKDTYAEKVRGLIEAKARGEKIVAPPQTEHPKVINIMDALKKSLAEKRQKPAAKKPAARKKMAPSTGRTAQAKRRKKSS